MNARTCTAPTKSGAPCKMAPMQGADRCVVHGRPDLAAKGRSKGGQVHAGQMQRAAEPDALADADWTDLYLPEECEAALVHIALEVLRGRMGVREAAVAARVVGRLLDEATVNPVYRRHVAAEAEAEDRATRKAAEKKAAKKKTTSTSAGSDAAH